MKKKKVSQNYQIFARYYDKYMAQVQYDHWIEFVLSQYNHLNGKSPLKILELACGTGNIANRLTQRGFYVDASDISDPMLDIARNKPFAAKFFKADMLSAIKFESYDLILLLFDSINYLEQPAKISKLLDNVACGLRSDGIFIFDISTSRNCRENFDGFINIEDDERGFMIHVSEFEPAKFEQTNHITFFIPGDGNYHRYDEVHTQKIYLVNEILSLIDESALKLIGIYQLVNDIEVPIHEKEYSYADRIYNRLFFILGTSDAQA